MNSRVRPSRRTAKKGRWRVTRTINFCCYLHRIWTVRQTHEKKSIRTYEFYQSKFNLWCWDSRESVATLTKSAACAQEFRAQIRVGSPSTAPAHKSEARKRAQKDFPKKVGSNHRVLSVKVIRVDVSPARERSDHHQVLRLRTKKSATYRRWREASIL